MAEGESSNNVASDIEVKILEICQKSPDGIVDKDLQVALPAVSAQQRVEALNKLITQGKVQLMKKGNNLLYKLKEPSLSVKCTGAEEKLVYQIIEKARNKGIWIRDIRGQSNLTLTHVNKILKTLEGKKLIKSVKAINASKKKVYMLYDLEPDSTVTGGSWYSDQEFESEFVDVLNQQCFRYLQHAMASAKEKGLDPISERNASYKSSKEIWRFIKELKISKVELSVEDIETILNTLIFDGKIEKTVVGDSDNLYRVLQSAINDAAVLTVPCGMCPLLHDCHDTGDITPYKCEYMLNCVSKIDM